MAIEKINIIQSSKNFEGNLATFLQGLDTPQALGRYVLDNAFQKSFFNNFPGLIYRKVSETDRVGDLILIDEKFNVAIGGTSMPGPYMSTRQLAGNESIIDAAYRRDRMMCGIHRHAVAKEVILQTELLPTEVTAQLVSSLGVWATLQEDNDVSCTLFRDRPSYSAEVDGLTTTQVDERVSPLFGRGTFNDVFSDPTLIMPNGVLDIEALTSTDTLSDVFLEYIQRFCDQELGMPYGKLAESLRPFYSLIVGDPDIMNFFRNASNTFKTDMNSAFFGKEWNHPIFTKYVGTYGKINLMAYGWMANMDGRDEFAEHMSVYKHIKGSPYEPIAKVLAAARGDQTVTDMKIYDRGAYNLTTPASRAGLDGLTTTYNLYISMGAMDFPYFAGCDGTGDTTIGSSSYNNFVLTSVETAHAYCGLTNGDIVGRMQLGEMNTAGGKYKILYAGPVYVGKLQLAANKTKYAQVQDIYRLKVLALYTWSGTAWVLVDDAGIAAAFAALKTYLGIDATNHIIVGSTYGGVLYMKRRKCHMFNTIRSLIYGKDLIFDADILKGQKVEQEKRDYGALIGWGMTMSRGRKIAISPDGTIRNYGVVVFKRPPVLS